MFFPRFDRLQRSNFNLAWPLQFRSFYVSQEIQGSIQMRETELVKAIGRVRFYRPSDCRKIILVADILGDFLLIEPSIAGVFSRHWTTGEAPLRGNML